jgi:fermentation-respiration switch protein FrsA (DUF1100 family)
MKRVIILSVYLLLVISTFSQDIKGSWSGVLNTGLSKLTLVLNISEKDGVYSATLDSPNQGAKGIPVSKINFENAKLTLSIANAGLEYEGIWQTDSIVGTFKQNGMVFPLNLKKTEEIYARPQEPKPPYPYISEDITFENKSAGITLAGTLTMPKEGKNFPAVILVTGSGGQNRDEELMGHKPFLVISDYLTRNGIAVLRYDDRGVAKSGGNLSFATTADLSTDAESAVAYLKTRKEINSKKIGLMGHSEGGVIAPMVAARSKDVVFIVMLAGTGLRGDVILSLQSELIQKVSGVPESRIAEVLKINTKIYDKIIKTNVNLSHQEITDFLTGMKTEIAAVTPGGISDDQVKALATQMSSPWMQYFLRYDPAPTLEKVKCPVLALNGEKDLQVPPKENLSTISAALKKGGNKKVTVKEYPGLNHLFQECTTGSHNEYAMIEQTFSPEVLNDIVNWIKQVVQ